MTWLDDLPIVTLVTFLPALGALVIAFTPTGRPNMARYLALGFALAAWVVSLVMLAGFVAGDPAFQFTESLAWIPTFGINYAVGVDGLSIVLVVLTTTLTWISILASFGPIQNRVKEYMISFLVLEVGMTGVFVAMDLFLFYIFWELVLVPMYLIIGIWGGKNRIYATIKFVLYTLVGSLLMLVAILATAYTYQSGHGGSWARRLRRPGAGRLRGDGRLRRHVRAARLRCVLPGVRDQGPHVPVPHLAARCARRGADGRLGHPGRRPAELGATGPSGSRCRFSRGGARLGPADHRPAA